MLSLTKDFCKNLIGMVLGIRDKTLEWISSFLSNHAQKVVIDKAFCYLWGSPRDSLGSHFVSNLHKWPTQQYLVYTSSWLRLFADDCHL